MVTEMVVKLEQLAMRVMVYCDGVCNSHVLGDEVRKDGDGGEDGYEDSGNA